MGGGERQPLLPAGVTSIGLLGVPVFGLLCSAAVLGESWTARCWPAWGLIVGDRAGGARTRRLTAGKVEVYLSCLYL